MRINEILIGNGSPRSKAKESYDEIRIEFWTSTGEYVDVGGVTHTGFTGREKDSQIKTISFPFTDAVIKIKITGLTKNGSRANARLGFIGQIWEDK